MAYKKVSPKKRSAAFARTSGRCAYCGTLLAEEEATVDHINPVSKGGCSSNANLVASCKACNSSKGARTLEEFRLRCAANRSGIPVHFTLPQLQFLKSLDLLPAIGIDESVTFFIETVDKTPPEVAHAA